METRILNYFAEFLEKQDWLSKLTEHSKLHEYGYSEIHVIATIGDTKYPNVTSIAQALKLTKGAVSKITKKLRASGILETFNLADNKQKIYFRLTSKGRFLYEEHNKRHNLWLERDKQFLNQFSTEQLEQISTFMIAYNDYLETQIQELGGR